ncbi:hypothetical protein [Citrobacter braakii]|uniref:hypothetical protein n=1 Tax=Citrobacter braakii TaxID=57706 RepID=UPI004039649A
MRYRKLSTVADLFNCSQAKASIMLRRFCDNFNEELFDYKTRNLTPTSYAYEVHEKCEEVLSGLDCVFFHHVE